jgi:hypothetical protein
MQIARSARKVAVKPTAAYMPNFGPIPSNSEDSLHGVLHSMKLPPTLAGKILQGWQGAKRVALQPYLLLFQNSNILAGWLSSGFRSRIF